MAALQATAITLLIDTLSAKKKKGQRFLKPTPELIAQLVEDAYLVRKIDEAKGLRAKNHLSLAEIHTIYETISRRAFDDLHPSTCFLLFRLVAASDDSPQTRMLLHSMQASLWSRLASNKIPASHKAEAIQLLYENFKNLVEFVAFENKSSVNRAKSIEILLLLLHYKPSATEEVKSTLEILNFGWYLKLYIEKQPGGIIPMLLLELYRKLGWPEASRTALRSLLPTPVLEDNIKGIPEWQSFNDNCIRLLTYGPDSDQSTKRFFPPKVFLNGQTCHSGSRVSGAVENERVFFLFSHYSIEHHAPGLLEIKLDRNTDFRTQTTHDDAHMVVNLTVRSASHRQVIFDGVQLSGDIGITIFAPADADNIVNIMKTAYNGESDVQVPRLLRVSDPIGGPIRADPRSQESDIFESPTSANVPAPVLEAVKMPPPPPKIAASTSKRRRKATGTREPIKSSYELRKRKVVPPPPPLQNASISAVKPAPVLLEAELSIEEIIPIAAKKTAYQNSAKRKIQATYETGKVETEGHVAKKSRNGAKSSKKLSQVAQKPFALPALTAPSIPAAFDTSSMPSSSASHLRSDAGEGTTLLTSVIDSTRDGSGLSKMNGERNVKGDEVVVMEDAPTLIQPPKTPTRQVDTGNLNPQRPQPKTAPQETSPIDTCFDAENFTKSSVGKPSATKGGRAELFMDELATCGQATVVEGGVVKKQRDNNKAPSEFTQKLRDISDGTPADNHSNKPRTRSNKKAFQSKSALDQFLDTGELDNRAVATEVNQLISTLPRKGPGRKKKPENHPNYDKIACEKKLMQAIIDGAFENPLRYRIIRSRDRNHHFDVIVKKGDASVLTRLKRGELLPDILAEFKTQAKNDYVHRKNRGGMTWRQRTTLKSATPTKTYCDVIDPFEKIRPEQNELTHLEVWAPLLNIEIDNKYFFRREVFVPPNTMVLNPENKWVWKPVVVTYNNIPVEWLLQQNDENGEQWTRSKVLKFYGPRRRRVQDSWDERQKQLHVMWKEMGDKRDMYGWHVGADGQWIMKTRVGSRPVLELLDEGYTLDRIEQEFALPVPGQNRRRSTRKTAATKEVTETIPKKGKRKRDEDEGQDQDQFSAPITHLPEVGIQSAQPGQEDFDALDRYVTTPEDTQQRKKPRKYKSDKDLIPLVESLLPYAQKCFPKKRKRNGVEPPPIGLVDFIKRLKVYEAQKHKSSHICFNSRAVI